MLDALAPATTRCFEENTLDALGRGERERAARHLDGCGECRETLALLGRVLDAAGAGAAATEAARAARPEHLPAGARVGRDTVLHEVGRGSMGVVYAA